ncbi:MAG: ribosome-associated translation inhibitor RaiA [Paracoccaceae bacterium]
MRYQISGRQIDVGNALQVHVESELTETFEKYAQRPTDGHVSFAHNGGAFLCEISVHLSTGITVASKGQDHEIYAAFETAREKLDKQVRRYKRRLRDHHRARPEPVAYDAAPYYVLAADDGSEDSEPEGLQPIIIAETESKISSLSVGEAVMQMELAGAPLLVFRNEKHGEVNVVYRRDDQNIGWIDPVKRS